MIDENRASIEARHVHQTYMLDTNVFNDVLDEKISLDSFAGCRLLALGVQLDELRATEAPPGRRAKLLAVFEEINPTMVPASSFAFGIEGAGWGQAYWNDGSGNFDKMLDRLRQLDHESTKRKSRNPLNKERDILIAEAAIRNRATLVSRDLELRRVVSEFGGFALDLREVRPIETREELRAALTEAAKAKGEPPMSRADCDALIDAAMTGEPETVENLIAHCITAKLSFEVKRREEHEAPASVEPAQAAAPAPPTQAPPHHVRSPSDFVTLAAVWCAVVAVALYLLAG